ncbi:MAG: PmoA family protein [Armatimonadota bacterium]|nr:PmoA family protein [Armatimonadota bacterium]MCX7778071.1 PmoA family protein [Armatimonadota bacterium]MDW8025750.1 PmoA family protein [Armatimonadota bacterium]
MDLAVRYGLYALLLSYASAVAPAVQDEPQKFKLIHKDGEKVTVLFGGRQLFEYRYSHSYPKPYVHPIWNANGVAITLDSPSDHKHHRGLFIGWSNINGADFWGESTGRIVHRSFERLVAGELAKITALIHWVVEATGKALLIERRTLTAFPPSKDLTMFVWESELTANEELTLSGAQYNGLGIRFIRSMNGGNVLNSNGTTEIKRANGERASWCAYFGNANGSLCTVAIFSHPSNPRHPTPFFVMDQPFGFLSAAPTFYEPIKLKPNDVLRLRYLIITFVGKADGKVLNEIYDQWTSKE